MFATAGSSIKLWDAQNYSLYQEISSGRVGSLTWSQNGNGLASLEEGTSEISLYAINSKSIACIGALRALDSPSCLKFPCRSSHYLGVGSKDGIVALWNLKSKSQKKAFSVTNSPISRIAFSHNDSHVTAASGGNVYLLSTINNSVGGPFKIFNQAITDVSYSMVKKSLLGCCSEGGSVSLFDANTNKVLHTFANAHMSPVSSVTFSPINELLMMSVGYDKKFVCYSIQRKKQIFTHKSSVALTSAALLPGCQHVALGALNGEVFIHDLRTLRKPLTTLKAHDSAVTNIILQPTTKHISDGSSSSSSTESRNTNTEPKKRSDSSKEGSLKSSSAPPPSEPNHDVVTSTKPEGACATAIGSSEDVLSSILSPVRHDQISLTKPAFGEALGLPRQDDDIDTILSPLRGYDQTPIDNNTPSSSKKTSLIQDIFSPVRVLQSDAPSEFCDLFSPVRNMSQKEDSVCSQNEVHSPNYKNYSQLHEKSEIDAILDTSGSSTIQEYKHLTTSLKENSQKENMDPNLLSNTPKSGNNNAKATDEVISAKTTPNVVVCPPESVSDHEPKCNSSIINSTKKHKKSLSNVEAFDVDAMTNFESCLNLPTLSTQTSDINDYSASQKSQGSEVNEHSSFEIGNTASHMQRELIRSCMEEVVEVFQDDVNRRMMHLQFLGTKHFLQLKDAIQVVQSKNALIDDLLLENERLRKENALLRAKF